MSKFFNFSNYVCVSEYAHTGAVPIEARRGHHLISLGTAVTSSHVSPGMVAGTEISSYTRAVFSLLTTELFLPPYIWAY